MLINSLNNGVVFRTKPKRKAKSRIVNFLPNNEVAKDSFTISLNLNEQEKEDLNSIFTVKSSRKYLDSYTNRNFLEKSLNENRPYRKGLSDEKTISILSEDVYSGKLNQGIVEKALNIMSEFYVSMFQSKLKTLDVSK